MVTDSTTGRTLVALAAGAPVADVKVALDALVAAARSDDLVVLVAEPGSPAARAAQRHRRVEGRAELAAAGIVVVLDATGEPMTRSWLDRLDEAARRRATGDLVVVPSTNGAPHPQCPADVPDAGAGRAAVREWTKQLAADDLVELDGAPAGPCAWIATSEPITVSADDTATAVANRLADRSSVAVHPGVYVHQTSGVPFLGAYLIVRDEEDFLPACLASLVPIVDEVVVYDTGSTDATVRLARAAGAVVVEGYWDDDFARAKNAALAACRSTWVLNLDADETIEHASRVGRSLARALAGPALKRVDAVGLWLHDLRGSELAPYRSVQGNLVTRLHRRSTTWWRGAIHEQVVERAALRSAVRVVLPEPRILHAGYLPEVMERRRKTDRNLRIARAAVERDPADLQARFDLARSLTMASEREEALAHFEVVADECSNEIIARSALELGAAELLELGRPTDAIAWADRLAERTTPDLTGVPALLRARGLVALGDHAGALAALDGATGFNDRFSHNPADAVATFRALAHVHLGDHESAARCSLDAVVANPVSPAPWPVLITVASSQPDAIGRAAAAASSEALTAIGSQLLTAQPRDADVVLDALWSHHGPRPELVAVAAELAPHLGVDRAEVWSRRLRDGGFAALCPLTRIAEGDGDDDGKQLDERVAASVALARVLLDAGVPAEALAAAAHATVLAGREVDLLGELLGADELSDLAEAADDLGHRALADALRSVVS